MKIIDTAIEGVKIIEPQVLVTKEDFSWKHGENLPSVVKFVIAF